MKQGTEFDPRVIRTRGLLRTALMELAVEKSFASLTIQDVTRRAGLNRTTFYLHFNGLHELLEDCARSLFAELRGEIYANLPAGSPPDLARVEPFIESVFHHLGRHEKFYRAMLGKQGDPYFRELFQDHLSELIFEPLAAGSPGGEINQRYAMTLHFFSAGFAGVAAWWLEAGMQPPAETAARQVNRDILPGYLRFLSR